VNLPDIVFEKDGSKIDHLVLLEHLRLAIRRSESLDKIEAILYGENRVKNERGYGGLLSHRPSEDVTLHIMIHELSHWITSGQIKSLTYYPSWMMIGITRLFASPIRRSEISNFINNLIEEIIPNFNSYIESHTITANYNNPRYIQYQIVVKHIPQELVNPSRINTQLERLRIPDDPKYCISFKERWYFLSYLDLECVSIMRSDGFVYYVSRWA